MAILPSIQNPRDLRKLPKGSLEPLAQELRQLLLQTVAEKGGHLASNLGTVELTLALHYIFETPADKIVWDVGHQAYNHKILTGRQKRFTTIRQYEGLSGFTSRAESEYDHFGAGHASTSVSAALGIAEGMRQRGESHFAIAVMGDGSLTGGLVYEGLNNAGHIPARNLLVVFNDNEMSIDPNVGALSKSVSGKLFEHFGFQYLGPIDGHSLPALLETLESVRNQGAAGGPYLVHAITRKGKGYPLAEEWPVKYHGVNPFKIEQGLQNFGAKKANYQDIFADTLIRLAKENPQVVAITAAMPSGTGLVKFQKEIPERFYDVGIAEAHAVLFAAGLATEGLRPVAAIYSTFLQRAYDQIIHDVGLQKLPVVFAMDRAGLVGADGATHQGAFDLTYLRAVPHMVIAAPKDENELQHLLKTALDYTEGPMAIRYPRGEVVGVPLDTELRAIPIGEGELLSADSDSLDVLLVAVGYSVQTALEAQTLLRQEGLRTGVINARYIKPLDERLLLEWAHMARLIVTVEENTSQGGFGAAVLELFSKNDVQRGTLVLGMPDQFIDHASPQKQRELCGLDAQSLVKKTLDKLAFLPRERERVEFVRSLSKQFIGGPERKMVLGQEDVL